MASVASCWRNIQNQCTRKAVVVPRHPNAQPFSTSRHSMSHAKEDLQASVQTWALCAQSKTRRVCFPAPTRHTSPNLSLKHPEQRHIGASTSLQLSSTTRAALSSESPTPKATRYLALVALLAEGVAEDRDNGQGNVMSRVHAHQAYSPHLACKVSQTIADLNLIFV